jgi:hypothetical protein
VATEAEYRRIAFSLPEVVEELYYGSPSFKVGKAFLTRLREDGEDVVVPMGREERDFWIEQEPEIFHVTPHYVNYDSVLVRLAAIDGERLEQLLRAGWSRVAKPPIRKKYPEMTQA